MFRSFCDDPLKPGPGTGGPHRENQSDRGAGDCGCWTEIVELNDKHEGAAH